MRYLKYFVIAVLAIGCKSQQVITMDPQVDEIRNLDTLLVTAAKEIDYEEIPNELPVYRESFRRSMDLLHTKLDLRFDWQNEHVIGIATLRVTPLAKSGKILQLDAKNFDIKSVSDPKGKELNYEYEEDLLFINLGQLYHPGQEFEVIIDYVAKPAEGVRGGSSAISSDQGLFFINPSGENPFKPQQIWTQGETEWNSRWFPTIDKPNERCTQEMFLTVEDKFKTLSNGTLISSSQNSDGTRTDYWRMDLPHAPYLFALAIGEYALVTEKWKDIPIEYYVEPEYEKDAKAIFPHTPEMMEFFSNKLGLEYPWSKYSQVVVRDYVSGAMENTTAVIFGEFMQDDARALEDNTYSDQIVAHELFHHWFGDYVTCESWANLAMNEGFANYSEYLWIEHKYGRTDADYLRLTEVQGYLQSIAYQGQHPLIHFSYADKEDMFDAHSYNKGGLILHMLRRYVGDDLFFKGLNLYLNDNAFTAVEAHDLRLAFEEVTGEDLNWFWNQWYFGSGHPRLEVSKSILDKKVLIAVQQTQEGANVPSIFQLPVIVDIIKKDGSRLREEIWIDQRVQSFQIPVDFQPVAVIFDADDSLLAEVEYEPKPEEIDYIFRYSEAFIHKYIAFGMLLQKSDVQLDEYVNLALHDSSWVIRFLGLTALEGVPNKSPFHAKVIELAGKDENVLVQSLAIEWIAKLGLEENTSLLQDIIAEGSPFEATKAAIKALQELNDDLVISECEELINISEAGILYHCSEAFAETEKSKYWEYFNLHLDKSKGEAALDFFGNYIRLGGTENLAKSLERLSEIAAHPYESNERRAAAFRTYRDNASESKIEDLKSKIEANTDKALFNLITQGRE